jgi:hypothetical protein
MTEDFLVSLEYLSLEEAKKRVESAGYKPYPIAETLALEPNLGNGIVILRHTEGPSPHVTGARAGDPFELER